MHFKTMIYNGIPKGIAPLVGAWGQSYHKAEPKNKPKSKNDSEAKKKI